MKLKFLPIHSPIAIAAALALSALSSPAQNVEVTTSLSPVMGAGGVFDYTLSLKNTGSEAIESFWLGWVPGSFNLASVSNPGNDLGWSSVISLGASVQYGGTVGSALAVGQTGIFTFDSTTTPAEFMAQTAQAGLSTAYGVDAANGQLSLSLSAPDTETFGLTLATPEPSTIALFALGSLGLLALLRRKSSVATSRVN